MKELEWLRSEDGIQRFNETSMHALRCLAARLSRESLANLSEDSAKFSRAMPCIAVVLRFSKMFSFSFLFRPGPG